MRPDVPRCPAVTPGRALHAALRWEASPLGDKAHAGSSTGRAGLSSRRPLMYAIVVLLGLILLLTVTGAWFGIPPVVLIGFPVAVVSATALILALLVLAGPRGEAPEAVDLGERLVLSFCATVVVDAQTGRMVMANDAARDLFGPARVAAGVSFSELLTSGAPAKETTRRNRSPRRSYSSVITLPSSSVVVRVSLA